MMPGYPDNYSSRAFDRVYGPAGRRAWTPDELRDVMLSDTAAMLIEQTAMVLRLLPEVGRHWARLATLKSAIEELEYEAKSLRRNRELIEDEMDAA